MDTTKKIDSWQEDFIYLAEKSHEIILPILFDIHVFSTNSAGIFPKPLIENRRWVLDKITNLESKKSQFVEEYHYLEFRGGRVRFAIDCNGCSTPYEFVSKDTVQIAGPGMCTRRGCLERDVIRIEYKGKYQIWRQGMYMVIRTGKEDHFYK